jgi:hypothetical protein
MSHCSNCQKPISCGCQRRTASNGKSCCSSCISQVEASLNTNVGAPQNKPYIWDIPKPQFKNK